MKAKHLVPILFISLILSIYAGFAAETDPPHHIHLTW